MSKIKILGVGFVEFRTSKDEYELIAKPNVSNCPNFNEFDVVIFCSGLFYLPKEEGLFGPRLTEEGVKRERQMIAREKELLNALEDGKTVCFLIRNVDDELISRIEKKAGLRHKSLTEEATDLDIKRSEFDTFIKNFGVAQLYYLDEEVDDVICKVKDLVVGFSKKIKNGNVVFLPCNPYSFERESLLLTLTESLISYSTRLIEKIPDWIDSFVFPKEKKIKDEITVYRKKIASKKPELDRYFELKSILWLGNNELVGKVRAFLREIGLMTKRNEIYEEDFWIVDDRGNEQVIVEVKGKNGNLTRPDISKLDEHRGAREKPDDFPALLIVNSFRDSKSLDEKDKEISPNEVKKAVRTNVLVMRTIDLCNIYILIEKNRMKPEKFLDLIKKEKGWLRVGEQNFEIKTE